MTPSLVQGIAVALFFVPLTSITLSGLTPDRLPAASGLSNFMRTSAGAFGTSITATIWSDRTAMHHAQLAEQVVEGRAVVDGSLEGLRSAGFDQDQALALVNRLVDQQSFTLSTVELNYASSAIFLLLLSLVWFRARHAPVPVRGDERHCRPASDRAPARSPAGAGHLRAVAVDVHERARHSIANVSLPAIAGDLGASPHQGTWVITSFGVATAISVPLTGWLAARFGQVRLFMASVLLFVLASWLCGLAPTSRRWSPSASCRARSPAR